MNALLFALLMIGFGQDSPCYMNPACLPPVSTGIAQDRGQFDHNTTNFATTAQVQPCSTSGNPCGDFSSRAVDLIIDVPAIQVCKVKVAPNEVCPGEVNDLNRSVEGFRKYGPMGYRWTCADKSRILLTSEDGKKHCVKFN